MKHDSIGSLHDDLSMIADRIRQIAGNSMVIVWVNECAKVYADREDGAADVAPHCIVGTYSMGMDASDIVEDLREARRERRSIGLLD